MMIQINASKSTNDVTDKGAEISQGTFKLKCGKNGVTGDAAFEISKKNSKKINYCKV